MEWRGYGRAHAAAAAAALVITLAIPVLGGVASASTRAVPKAMVGCWHRHVPALPGLSPAGVWLMRITSLGQLAAYTPGTTSCASEPDFNAIVSITGNRLTIGPVPVCATKGVYRWAATAKTLTLHATADKSCSPRTVLFNGVWKRR